MEHGMAQDRSNNAISLVFRSDGMAPTLGAVVAMAAEGFFAQRCYSVLPRRARMPFLIVISMMIVGGFGGALGTTVVECEQPVPSCSSLASVTKLEHLRRQRWQNGQYARRFDLRLRRVVRLCHGVALVQCGHRCAHLVLAALPPVDEPERCRGCIARIWAARRYSYQLGTSSLLLS